MLTALAQAFQACGVGTHAHLVPEHDQDLAAQDDALQAAAAAGALPRCVKVTAVLIVTQPAAHDGKAVVPAPRQHLHDEINPLYLPETPAQDTGFCLLTLSLLISAALLLVRYPDKVLEHDTQDSLPEKHPGAVCGSLGGYGSRLNRLTDCVTF